MAFPSRSLLLLAVAGLAVARAHAAEPWPFDQRQILLVSTEGQSFPDDLTTAQIMDVFARRGRVRWVTQKSGAGSGGLAPVMVPRDFPWHSSVAVRNLGLRYKADGLVSLAQRGVLVDLRWYATVDGQPLFFETASLPDAGPRPGEAEARKQRLLDWLGEMWARIPGRGYVVKRDLTTITLEGAQQEGIKNGDKLELRRLQKLNRHPLLKTLVGIDSSISGTATVTSVGEPLAVAKIDYESGTDPIQEGDRYLPAGSMPAENPAGSSVPVPPSEPQALGEGNAASLLPELGAVNFLDVTARALLGTLNHQETMVGATTPQSMSSLAPGFEAQARLYLTREWMFGGDAAFSFLNFKNLDTATFGGASSSGEYSNFRFYGGYRFIFLESEQGVGDFEIVAGFRRASFGVSPLAAATAPQSKAFSGIDLGIGVSVPMDAGLGFYFKADRMFGSALTESPLSAGATVASVVWNFEGGVRYGLMKGSDVSLGLSFFRASSTYSGTGTRATSSLSSLVSGTLFNAGYTHKF